MAIAKNMMGDEIRSCGRALMLSNHTMGIYSEKATPRQAEFLLQMMHEELRYRDENRRKRLVSRAKFPVVKTIDAFEWLSTELPGDLTREELVSCRFAEQAQNLVLYGPVGTGKTHLAIALGTLACEKGMRVRFTTTSELVLRLMGAKDDGTLERALKEYANAELLILDEWGYVPVDRDGARLLFQVISQSYESRSLLLTTNLEFSKWGSVLTDDQMAAAMIDRLAHHGHLIIFKGESYRMKHALMRK